MMMLAVGVLALLVFLLCGVVYELLSDVRQLRDAVGILDRPLGVDLGPVADTKPSVHGLPRALDSASSALVLFLSDRCGTCRSLAEGLGGRLPPGLWIVLESSNEQAAAKFIDSYDMAAMMEEGRLIIDPANTIANHIGLDVTPTGFRVEDGTLASATTVPSKRYLLSILPKPLRLGQRQYA